MRRVLVNEQSIWLLIDLVVSYDLPFLSRQTQGLSVAYVTLMMIFPCCGN